MNYRDALNFVHSRLKFGSRPGLDNIRRITELCGNPQCGMRFIHIAGTNGKGSISTMLSNIMIADGKKTGLFISPFVVDFRERIQVNGKMIPKADFARIITELKPLVERTDREGYCVTEFELVTCAALMYYKEQNCDCVVLEVGMGGRLDATNVIDKPLVSVVARIDLDHTAVLGDSAEKIAFEKCGIIKNGCPTVMYPDQYDEVSATVRKICKERNSNLIVPPTDFATEYNGVNGTKITVNGVKITLPLIGVHQRLNAATAVSAALCVGVPSDAVAKGVAATRFAARMEIISKKPTVILDGAHNPNGAKALSDSLDVVLNGEKAVAIMGMLADKDTDDVLRILSPHFSDIITLTVPNPRTMTATELKNKAKAFCPSVYSARSYIEAITLAAEKADGAPIVVCGSLYLASAIRPKLLNFYK